MKGRIHEGESSLIMDVRIRPSYFHKEFSLSFHSALTKRENFQTSKVLE